MNCTSESEAMPENCPLQLGGELLPQAKEFKYLRVLFTSDGKVGREMDMWFGEASAALQAIVPDRCGERGSQFTSCVHELWVVTKRAELQLQVDELSFLSRGAGVSLSDRVRRSDICGELGVDPLSRKEPAEVVLASD